MRHICVEADGVAHYICAAPHTCMRVHSAFATFIRSKLGPNVPEARKRAAHVICCRAGAGGQAPDGREIEGTTAARCLLHAAATSLQPPTFRDAQPLPCVTYPELAAIITPAADGRGWLVTRTT